MKTPHSYCSRVPLLRVGASVGCVVCALVMPWWVAMLVVAGVLLFSRFYELVLVGLVVGVLYGGVWVAPYVLALSSVVALSFSVRRVLWKRG